jgi:AsmA protein
MLKWFLIGAGVLLLLVVGAIAALPWVLDTPALQAYVAQAAARALGRPVKFVSLSVSALPLPGVRLNGLEVAEDPAFGPGPFVTVGEGRIGIRLRPLLSGRVELADLTLEEPRIALVGDAAGRLNLASLGMLAPAAPGSSRGSGARSAGIGASGVVLSSVRVVNGSVQYRQLGVNAPALRLEKINVTVSQAAPGAALRMSGEAVAQPGAVRLSVRDASLAPGGARAAGDMPLRATLDLEAPDVAALGAVLAASPAVSGAMKGRLELAGTPARVAVSGAVTVDRLTLSEHRPQCQGPARRQLVIEALRIPLLASPARIDSAPVRARVARGIVSLNATVLLGPAATATLKGISIKGTELAPVLVDYLCQGYAVTGALDLDGEASLRLADVWGSAAGSGRVRIGPGKVVGNDVVSLVREIVGLGGAVASTVRSDRPPRPSPLDFDSITATYTMAGGVARTADLLYQARDVKVAAAGTYGLADGRVAMEVTLTEGTNQIRGLVTGGPGSLRVVPTGITLPGARDVRKFLDRLFR